ncbi:MAG: hypothetical protein EBR30_22125 [Cytophagia bacterium]|nr:hypothetical protein [Cytophagia bacterium]NBW37664.1 hypothetical protein [Cytophagia bacterium]
MPIKKNLGDLPVASTGNGVRPDADPFIGRAIAQAWLDQNYQESKAHAVEGSRFRFSMAGSCGRQLQFYIADAEVTNPPDAADAWRMGLGTMVHTAIQEYFERSMVNNMFDCNYYTVEMETKTSLPEISGSGHVDMFFTLYDKDEKPYRKIVVEIKTLNGFGFKVAATGFKGPAEGPRRDHIKQAALSAYALDADDVIICYVSMENVSASLAGKYCDDPVFGRFTAQWTYSKAEWMPLAEAEILRVRAVLNQIDYGSGLVDPTIENDDGLIVTITDPSTGRWELTHEDQLIDSGRAWQCGYCRYRDLCLKG